MKKCYLALKSIWISFNPINVRGSNCHWIVDVPEDHHLLIIVVPVDMSSTWPQMMRNLIFKTGVRRVKRFTSETDNKTLLHQCNILISLTKSVPFSTVDSNLPVVKSNGHYRRPRINPQRVALQSWWSLALWALSVIAVDLTRSCPATCRGAYRFKYIQHLV